MHTSSFEVRPACQKPYDEAKEVPVAILPPWYGTTLFSPTNVLNVPSGIILEYTKREGTVHTKEIDLLDLTNEYVFRV